MKYIFYAAILFILAILLLLVKVICKIANIFEIMAKKAALDTASTANHKKTDD